MATQGDQGDSKALFPMTARIRHEQLVPTGHQLVALGSVHGLAVGSPVLP